MLDLNKGEHPIDYICALHQFPGPGTDDYILLNNTYTVLKKKEAAGTLLKEEPSLKTSDGSFDLNDYIRQKIWWYSGPEKYYMMEEDLKYMSLFLADGEKKIKETIVAYERNITNLKEEWLRIEEDYKKRIQEIKNESSLTNTLYYVTYFTIATVAPIIFLCYHRT